MVWERNLYRHSSVLGFECQEHYRTQHDIYSLGACSFDKGLLRPFVEFDADRMTNPRSLNARCTAVETENLSHETQGFQRPICVYGRKGTTKQDRIAENGDCVIELDIF